MADKDESLILEALIGKQKIEITRLVIRDPEVEGDPMQLVYAEQND